MESHSHMNTLYHRFYRFSKNKPPRQSFLSQVLRLVHRHALTYDRSKQWLSIILILSGLFVIHSKPAYGVGFEYQGSYGYGPSSFQIINPDKTETLLTNLFIRQIHFPVYSLSNSLLIKPEIPSSLLDFGIGMNFEAMMLHFSSLSTDINNRMIFTVSPEIVLTVKHLTYPLWPTARIKYTSFPIHSLAYGFGAKIVVNRYFALTLEYNRHQFITTSPTSLIDKSQSQNNKTNPPLISTQPEPSSQDTSESQTPIKYQGRRHGVIIGISIGVHGMQSYESIPSPSTMESERDQPVHKPRPKKRRSKPNP